MRAAGTRRRGRRPSLPGLLVAQRVVLVLLLAGLSGCSQAGAGRDGAGPLESAPPTTGAESAPAAATVPAGNGTSSTRPQPTTTTTPPKGRVAVVGDSLTAQSEDWQQRRLTAAGWDPVVIDGVPGETIAERVLTIREVIRVQDLDVLVIALGTNDARMVFDSGTSLADGWYVTQASAFTALADAQAVPCVVWVGVNANSKKWHIDFWGGGFNEWLVRYTKLADWTAYSKGRPEWFEADTIHLTGEGADAYARLITETVDAQCPVAGTGPVL